MRSARVTEIDRWARGNRWGRHPTDRAGSAFDHLEVGGFAEEESVGLGGGPGGGFFTATGLIALPSGLIPSCSGRLRSPSLMSCLLAAKRERRQTALAEERLDVDPRWSVAGPPVPVSTAAQSDGEVAMGTVCAGRSSLRPRTAPRGLGRASGIVGLRRLARRPSRSIVTGREAPLLGDRRSISTSHWHNLTLHLP